MCAERGCEDWQSGCPRATRFTCGSKPADYTRIDIRSRARGFRSSLLYPPSRQRFQTSTVIDEHISIAEAARILKPLLVKQSDLEAVVADARARGTPSWSEEEKKMIAIIAKAWALLAPLGVEPADIRRLVNNAVRNAWK
jgi:hypothetical protein